MALRARPDGSGERGKTVIGRANNVANTGHDGEGEKEEKRLLRGRMAR
jgi:hypothetical protein